MKSQEFKQLLDRYSRGECTPEESTFIEEWYENMGKAGSGMGLANVEETEARMWQQIAPTKPAAANVRLWSIMKIAATLTIMLVAGWALTEYFNAPAEIATRPDIASTPKPRVVSNTSGQPLTVALSDGSRVVLQANSEISFDEAFSGTKREVYLRGEAFFDVQRDEARPFLVYSQELVTRVLGTSFNIKAYDGDKEITVAVKTGRVSVYHTPEGQTTADEEDAVILKPNQQAIYDKARESVVKQLVEQPEIILPDSKLFRMSFDEHPVSAIFQVLEEHYGVDIVFDEDALKRCTLTTAMSEEGLYERIEVICKAIKADYTTKEGIIFIESPGCN